RERARQRRAGAVLLHPDRGDEADALLVAPPHLGTEHSWRDHSGVSGRIQSLERECVAGRDDHQRVGARRDRQRRDDIVGYEQAPCTALGGRYAVAVANGAASLRCALAALGVGCGDEVVLPAFTFIATANAVIACGAVPVFAEVDETLGLDPRALDACITDKT